MDPLEFLRQVWRMQPRGFGFICSRAGATSWRDEAYRFPEQLLKLPDTGDDIYFSPNLFARPRRRRELMIASRWLYADLDKVDPIDLPDELSPTVAWESSPQRYQALWLLPRALEPYDHQQLNKRLTYAIDADRSGWDMTQVLRVPGTQNHKYGDDPDVLLLWFFDEPTPMKAVKNLPKVSVTNGSIASFEIPDLTPRQVLRALPPGTVTAGMLGKLRATSASGDRSRVLYRLMMTLLNKRVPPGWVYLLLRDTVWNKFGPDGLKADIARCAEKVRVQS